MQGRSIRAGGSTQALLFGNAPPANVCTGQNIKRLFLGISTVCDWKGE
jgi:hypothetical protein